MEEVTRDDCKCVLCKDVCCLEEIVKNYKEPDITLKEVSPSLGGFIKHGHHVSLFVLYFHTFSVKARNKFNGNADNTKNAIGEFTLNCMIECASIARVVFMSDATDLELVLMLDMQDRSRFTCGLSFGDRLDASFKQGGYDYLNTFIKILEEVMSYIKTLGLAYACLLMKVRDRYIKNHIKSYAFAVMDFGKMVERAIPQIKDSYD